ncbi:putative uncharacterized protein [Clostridium sp. CAG:356]|nr:putative uncharacterized protein [Clostridium sp. CAG:356]
MNASMNIIDNSIINVAILNSKILGENILEAYIPFVSTLIATKQYKEIKIEQICNDFYYKYSFKIPAMPMKEILSRMQKKDMIYRDKRGKIIPDLDKIYETDFESEYKETLKKYENISNKYIEFSKEKFQIDVSKEKAEECFSEFIKENFLDTVLNDENIKEVIENIDKEHISKEMYAFYKYVIYMYKTDYELFKVIQKFCMGYIVANALSLDNISSSNIIFKNKKIFFDTNFILRLLGLEGEFYQNSYIGIVDVLKENNCKLYVFPHTYDEIKNILETAKTNLNNTNELSPEVQKYFWNNNKTEGDIVLLIATLDKKLNNLGIFISRVAYDSTNSKDQIDEQALYDEIINIYSKRKNFDEKTKSDMIWNDVKSMALIYRDIKLIRAYSIQTLQDVFITTNQGLAYACKNFDKTLGKKENAIAPCMTDIFLGTILWVQNPIRYDKYNEKQILASCYSSVKLDNKSLSKFSIELENLKEKQKITNEDYMLMKDYKVVEDMLSDKIMGNSDNIDEKTTFEVIQEIKDNITKNYEAEILKEKEANLISEKEKNIAEKKYERLVANVKDEIKKEAKIKSIVKIAFYVVIYISVIIVDLYFNIIDLVNVAPKFIIFVRLFAYIILAIPSLVEIYNFSKTYKKYMAKLYKKKCKKLKIDK